MKTETVHAADGIMRRLRELLEASHGLLVVTHIDPDGDAIGTQLAFGCYFRDLGWPATLIRNSAIPAKYRFLPGADAILPTEQLSSRAPFDTVLVLECPNRDRLGSAAVFLERARTVINIDHHPVNSLSADLSWVDPAASSVGEMAFEYFGTVGYEIGPDVASQLYTAILTDTGRFRFESTTPRTLVVASELVRAGANPRTICDRVYFDQPREQMTLIGEVLRQAEYHDTGRICLLSLSKARLEETGADPADTEGLVDYSLYARGVQIGVLLREIDRGQTKISLRSRGGCDVAQVAGQLGGGGHPGAAGCRLPLPLEQAKSEIVRILREACEQKG